MLELTRFRIFGSLALASLIAFGGSAQAQDAPSIRELNQTLRINEESSAALQALIAAAEGGDAQAMFYVFAALNSGLGAERDLDTARMWLERSIEAGNVNARNTLGNILLNRDEDRDAALEQWRAAADEGNVGGLIRLAENAPLSFGRRVQLSLIGAGQDAGPVDGILGEMSLSALSSYLEDKDFKAACDDGVETLSCIRALARAGFFSSAD